MRYDSGRWNTIDWQLRIQCVIGALGLIALYTLLCFLFVEPTPLIIPAFYGCVGVFILGIRKARKRAASFH